LVGRLRDGKGEPHHELGFRPILGRELVHDLRHDAGAVIEPIAQRGIAMNKDALPRHQHVVEDRHRIGLVEARRERVIHRRGGVLVDHRRPADEAQTRRVDPDAEPEGVRLGFLAGGDVGRRQDDEVVGIGRQGGHHTGAADHNPGIRFLDDLGGEILVLLLDRF